MPVEREPTGSNLVEVLDRVLDKGIIIDAAVRIQLVGVDLLGVDARIVVASFETYLHYSDAIAHTGLAAGPPAPDSGAEAGASDALPVTAIPAEAPLVARPKPAAGGGQAAGRPREPEPQERGEQPQGEGLKEPTKPPPVQ